MCTRHRLLQESFSRSSHKPSPKPFPELTFNSNITVLGADQLTILRSNTYHQEIWIFGERRRVYTEKDCKSNMTLTEYLPTLLSPEVAKDKSYAVFLGHNYYRILRERYEENPIKETQIDVIDNVLKSTHFPHVKLYDINYRRRTYDYSTKLMELNVSLIRGICNIDSELDYIYSNSQKHLIRIGDIVKFFDIGVRSTVDTQINNIDPNFASETSRLGDIYEDIKLKIIDINAQAILMLPAITKLKQNRNDKSAIGDLLTIIDKMLDLFTNVESHIMDLYVLAKIFQKHTYGIFYGGILHSKYIIDYLTKSGYSITFSSRDSTGCISIPDIR